MNHPMAQGPYGAQDEHDGHNTHGVPEGDVEADTVSGGAPEDSDPSDPRDPAYVGIGATSPARAAQAPDDGGENGDDSDIPPENPSGG